MRYKIGDVARILGISADLLRYYEKKGVVTPYKAAHNDYRYYDAWDINLLMDCLWFKNFGFSIEQIADMVRIGSAQELDDIFQYKEDELRSTIRRCQLLLRRSEEHRAQMAAIPSLLGQCRLDPSPWQLRYINRVGNEYPTGGELDSFARQWLRAMPFNHRCFEIPRLGEAGADSGIRWGFSLSQEYVQELDFPAEPPMEAIESQISIHTVFRSRGKGNFSSRHLDYALQWARREHCQIQGPALGQLVASVLEDGQLCGYFECWIPIKTEVESL